MADDDPLVCECQHGPEDHDGGGPCRGVDSYGQRCACPSYQEMDDGDDPDDSTSTITYGWVGTARPDLPVISAGSGRYQPTRNDHRTAQEHRDD